MSLPIEILDPAPSPGGVEIVERIERIELVARVDRVERITRTVSRGRACGALVDLDPAPRGLVLNGVWVPLAR